MTWNGGQKWWKLMKVTIKVYGISRRSIILIRNFCGPWFIIILEYNCVLGKIIKNTSWNNHKPRINHESIIHTVNLWFSKTDIGHQATSNSNIVIMVHGDPSSFATLAHKINDQSLDNTTKSFVNGYGARIIIIT